eukprot:scaffold144459_cov33-Tisochrysis_lutea.AAC.1
MAHYMLPLLPSAFYCAILLTIAIASQATTHNTLPLPSLLPMPMLPPCEEEEALMRSSGQARVLLGMVVGAG